MSARVKTKARPAPQAGHDHASCVAHALSDARERAARSGLQLTPLRQRVLEIVASSHRPAGAYDVLAALQKERAAEGARAAPPTVYRALEFLVAQGLVHRIERLNAFVACFAGGEGHRGCFLLCEICGAATELHDPALTEALDGAAARAGFKARRETVEISGVCATCAK